MEINDNEDDNSDEIVEEFDFEKIRKNTKEENRNKNYILALNKIQIKF